MAQSSGVATFYRVYPRMEIPSLKSMVKKSFSAKSQSPYSVLVKIVLNSLFDSPNIASVPETEYMPS